MSGSFNFFPKAFTIFIVPFFGFFGVLQIFSHTVWEHPPYVWILITGAVIIGAFGVYISTRNSNPIVRVVLILTYAIVLSGILGFLGIFLPALGGI